MLLFQWVLAIIVIHLSQVTGESNMNRLVRPRLKRDVDTSEDCKSCSCGVSFHNRIIGGEDSNVKKYPWMTMLFSQGLYHCGGSLINNKYVLSAAHCVEDFPPSAYEVHFMHNLLGSIQLNAIVRKVIRTISHRNYQRRNWDSDIALLQLSESVKFSGQLNPVCLPSETDSFAGLDGIVVGWGSKRVGGKASRKLQELTLPIITLQQCRYFGVVVTENMMCAGTEQGGRDKCQGDSGSPIHVIIDSKFTEAGIVSWGYGCARPNSPGVYTLVPNFVSWIRENTADACYC